MEAVALKCSAAGVVLEKILDLHNLVTLLILSSPPSYLLSMTAFSASLSHNVAYIYIYLFCHKVENSSLTEHKLNHSRQISSLFLKWK